jgi:hypothetical protein
LSVHIPGTPSGWQATCALPSSSSARVIALSLAATSGLNGIGSCLVVGASATTLQALAFPVGPLNQTPEKST